MPNVLLVADATWVKDAVHAALSTGGYDVAEHSNPATVVTAVTAAKPDVVVVDLQVASMGGMAVTRAVRDAAAVGTIQEVPVVILLDRRADAFLARRAGASAWIAKPFEAAELRAALSAAAAAEAPA